MVDIHCHILPSVDDGAKNIEISLKMGKTAQENNVNKVVATPHYSCNAEDNGFSEKIKENVSFLQSSFKKNDIDVELFKGAEVYLNDDIYYDNQLERLTINSTRYILTELDFSGLTAKKIIRYLDEIVSRGLVPIIAHPERYQYFQKDYGLVNYLADAGVLFQVNMTSLAGIDTQESKMLATELVRSGMAAFLASDSHGVGLRHNAFLKYLPQFPAGIPDRAFYDMLENNPEKLLRNEPVRTKYRHINKGLF